MTDELILVAQVGGERVAFPASIIRSVIEIQTITTVPRAPHHVAGLTSLRSQALTVIDCVHSIGCQRGTSPDDRRLGLVVAEGACSYALMVEDVEGVSPLLGGPDALDAGLSAEWGRVSTGVIECEAGAMLLLDASALIAGPDNANLRRAA